MATDEAPERELQALLVQLADINTLIDEYEGTRDQQFLARVTEQMRHLAPKMKQFTVGQEGRSPEYSALRNKLTTGMREAVNRLKSLTPAPNTTTSNTNVSAATDDGGASSDDRTHPMSSVVTAAPPPPPPLSVGGLPAAHGTPPPTQLSGWLKKQGEKGPIKSWKKRYFRQSDSKLFYATNNTTLTSSGFIDLQQVTSILPGKGPTVFDLVTPTRTFHLKAFDTNDRKRWIEGLTFWRNVYSTITQLNAASYSSSVVPAPPSVATLQASTPNNSGSPANRYEPIEEQGGRQRRDTSSSHAANEDANVTPQLPQSTVTLTTTATFTPSIPYVASSSPSIEQQPSTHDQQQLQQQQQQQQPPPQPQHSANNSESQNGTSEYRLERSHTVASGANVKDFPKKKSALSRELQRSQSSVNAKAQMMSAMEENLSKKEGEIKRLNALVYQLRSQLKTTQEELETVKSTAVAVPPPAEQDSTVESQSTDTKTDDNATPAINIKQPSSTTANTTSGTTPSTDSPQVHNTTYETLVGLEKQFKLQEMEFTNNAQEVRKLQEEGRVKDEKITLLEEELKQAREEMAAKDGHINQLNEKIKILRGTAPNPNRLSVSKATNMLKEELEKLKESNYAHQVQNSLLCTEIKRLQNQSQAQLQAKNTTIKSLQKDLEEARHLYDDLREKVVLQKDIDTMQPFIDELKEVKQDLFYSMAVGIKLNLAMQGKSCNVDIQSLYEEAQNISPKKWHAWISNQLLENS
eukprot:TRINITY_DN624_c0_g1_i1.p1 TRINITY_DN624_c0_g1~~TRINITY_DN624_c0_g1_i1.p1  ORF type:complete len:749 (-),score=234.13 TRINITY_DN624_c0_g1_i1:126-2372(-)